MAQLAQLRKTIEQAIQDVLAASGRTPKPLHGSDALFADIGLDSLDLAQIVVLLEQRLEVDPFRVSGQAVRTLDDLEQAYYRLLERSA